MRAVGEAEGREEESWSLRVGRRCGFLAQSGSGGEAVFLVAGLGDGRDTACLGRRSDLRDATKGGETALLTPDSLLSFTKALNCRRKSVSKVLATLARTGNSPSTRSFSES